MICNHCGNPIEPNQRFCANCGQEIVKQEAPTCPNCGEKVAEGARFCSSCGTSLEKQEIETLPEPQVLLCVGCGAELAEDAKFCNQCGQPIEVPEDEESVVEEQIVEEPQALICAACGAELVEGSKFCNHCGQEVVITDPEPCEDLSDEESIPCVLLCLQCGAILSKDTKFCNQCGTEVGKKKDPTCVKCGAILDENTRFCSKCGTEVTKKEVDLVGQIKERGETYKKNLQYSLKQQSKLTILHCVLAGILALLLIFWYIPSFRFTVRWNVGFHSGSEEINASAGAPLGSGEWEDVWEIREARFDKEINESDWKAVKLISMICPMAITVLLVIAIVLAILPVLNRTVAAKRRLMIFHYIVMGATLTTWLFTMILTDGIVQAKTLYSLSGLTYFRIKQEMTFGGFLLFSLIVGGVVISILTSLENRNRYQEQLQA